MPHTNHPLACAALQSSAIASALTQVGEAFGCRGVQGVVTSSSGRYVVDGPRVIAGCKEDMYVMPPVPVRMALPPPLLFDGWP
jgi:hypothetical protein